MAKKSVTISIFIFFILSQNLFSISTIPNESIDRYVKRKINLDGKFEGRRQRSLNSVEAYLKDNIITIKFNVFLEKENLNIKISNSDTFKFEELYTLDLPEIIEFTFPYDENEKYYIEIIGDHGYLSGEF